MTRKQRGTGYVAALVARLGGDVIITDEEAAYAGDLTIEHDRARNQTRILLKPAEIVGEIVADKVLEAIQSGPAIVHYAKCGQCEYGGKHRVEWHTWADDEEAADMVSRGHADPRKQRCGCQCQAGAVEPPACQHPFKLQYWTPDGDLLCGPCGATVGHDEQMRIRSIQAGHI